ncbi:MAG: protein kinase [Polyangiaceae bacterium]|nr:protein kinase [Polyangiaceae bacterium]
MTALERQLLAERFEILREVGRGAAGVVFRAIDRSTGEASALKIIEPSEDPSDQERFLREGEVLSALSHPSIVRVLSYGTIDQAYADAQGRRFAPGSSFVAMEWLEGEDLAVRQKRASPALPEVLEITRQVAEALSCAHDAGIVHRDVKPSNVFLTYGATVLDEDRSGYSTLRGGPVDDGLPSAPMGATVLAKLLDFGVAAAGDTMLAGAGAIVGTPAYMAPEQAQGDAAPDSRSDLYSLGATLFELCAGRPPHAGPTSIATLARRVTDPAPRLSELLIDVPERLDELVSNMLQIDPRLRPRAASDIARSIAELLRDEATLRVGRLTLREADTRARVGTRLVTTLVALGVATGDERQRLLDRARQIGADALPLGADSIVAHLGARRAHGDEATRAIEIANELAGAGAKVGIATGRTRVDLTRSSGEIVDRAAKLAREAKDGRVNFDLTTNELARGRAEFDVPSLGQSGVVAMTTKRRPDSESSSFVGREAELLTALNAYERCTDDRTPIVVSTSGPPGIGKTRLGQELIARLERQSEPPRVMLVRCESYGKAQALGTASDALRSLLMLSKGSTVEQAERAIDAFFAGGQGAGARRGDLELTLLARLLSNQPFPEGVEPRAARDALYVAMTELVLEAANREPCALVVEDAQWADPESVAWVDHLIGRAQGRRLFTLLFVRPAFWRNHPQRFGTRDHVRIELKPMAKRAVREIARSLIGARATDAQLDQVAAQAAGSPLFAEELARLVAQGKGLSNAPTIEAAIQVSLDALDDVVRDAAARFTIFGLAGWDQGLASLYDPSMSGLHLLPPEVLLGKMVAADLLVESAKTRFSGTKEYLFKHALIRDVAYQMLGDDMKRHLHGRAAEWLESVGEDAATVAHHYDLGRMHDVAAKHWELAARRALATNSLADAAAMSERALAFADDKPTAFARAILLEEAQSRLDARGAERDTAIQSMRENVFDEASELRTEGAAARYDDARAQGIDIEARLRRVRDRARELGLLDEAARCSATLAQRLAFAGDLAAAEKESAAMLTLSETNGIVWAAVDAWQTLAVVHQTRGELAAALEARRNAARAARTAGLKEREAILTMNLGFALTTIGAKNEALVEIETGLERAHAIGSLGAVRHGQMNLLGWASTFGADQRVSQALAEPRAQADEAAAGAYVIQDRATLGVLFYRGVELLRGDSSNLARARGLLERVAQAYRTTGNLDILPVSLGFWSEAERRLGDAEHARELASEAASLLDQGAPSLLNEAPVYLALHDACVDLGLLAGARTAIEHGMPHLLRRLSGLTNTQYAHSFLTGLAHNAGLIAAAEVYGLVPPEVERLISRRG